MRGPSLLPMNSYNVIVIGAGPAGMMAALRAAELTDRVVLFEKNATLARKLGMTGKGRCNITNVLPLEEFLEKFGENGVFLRNAFAKFFTPELINFFASRGLGVKTERQGRVFPATDKATSVIDIFKRGLTKAGVEIQLSSPVKNVRSIDDSLKGVRLADGKEFFAKKIIVATGGLSYPQTGSTGDGFHIARGSGHCIEDISPGLVPLETEERWVKDLQGLTLKNIKITFTSGKKRIESGTGELMFTHFGVSGPLVLDLSGVVARMLKGPAPVGLRIDLKTGLSCGELDEKLVSELQGQGAMLLKNYLEGILPKRLVNTVLSISQAKGDKRCHQVTLAERKGIVEVLKRFPLTVKRPRPLSEAMVTHGGVSLKEIHPKTMESKKVKGLYFCGEVLDLAAASGGFNLQAAFSTGYVAGEAAALSLSKI